MKKRPRQRNSLPSSAMGSTSDFESENLGSSPKGVASIARELAIRKVHLPEDFLDEYNVKIENGRVIAERKKK